MAELIVFIMESLGMIGSSIPIRRMVWSIVPLVLLTKESACEYSAWLGGFSALRSRA